ncbi:MAG TPA: type II secretion system protein [Sedimentisphaerales bacterium]|nr:type II secretion system protein [Phycisphaerae bacterium]HON90486.1 type II secretion system protein [Sedimentisphaerales bacterium]HOV78395.1 type II secretion system protein [Sedimentisphaerales bacterium]
MRRNPCQLERWRRNLRGVLGRPGGHNRQSYGAFTLIELLVVISIIAILMGVLLPSLNRARKQAQKIACRSNLRQMGIALQTYLPDSGYRLPPSSCHVREPNDHWLRVLTRYTKEQLLFRCPSDKGKEFVDWDKPLNKQKDARYSSFAVNSLLDPICYRYGAGPNRYNCVNSIRRPMSCIWISEAPATESFRLADHIHPETWEGSVDYAKQFIAWDRHQGISHYLFADGHAEGLKFEHTYEYPGVCNWYPETAPKWPENP